MITRHVFQRQRHQPQTGFLVSRLQGAHSYDRIAGYFDSSLLEVAGEALESMTGRIRILCNAAINPADVAVAEQAQKQVFFKNDPVELAKRGKDRLLRLYKLLTVEGGPRMDVRVLPDDVFGLVHGKAGVISYADGKRTSFLGSANETFSGWMLNYELVWEDDSPEACDWVQAEFDRLWSHSDARPLADAVIKEIKRMAERIEVTLEGWKKDADPAAAAVEAPVYRKEFGLLPHQRDFIQTVWTAHRAYGARFVLADQVGLGKTVQLGMSAQLIALSEEKPVLALLPKTLLQQWQNELWDLLEVPTARWTGKLWVDEHGMEYPTVSKSPLLDCPRKIGLVSQGLVVSGSDSIKDLLSKEWSCVIVDEAHRARRKKLPKPDEWGLALNHPDSEANNLYAFLWKLASKTRSFLMGTATPVQLHPVEAYDLLRVLTENNNHVLGKYGGLWRNPDKLSLIMGKETPPKDLNDLWAYVRNPLPPRWESEDFDYIRNRMELPDTEANLPQEYDKLPANVQVKAETVSRNYFLSHHPYLRGIVRRTRQYLENTQNPATGKPFLDKVEVQLHGEEKPVVLKKAALEAYQAAEKFCKMLHERVPSAGFFKTLLLRRIGSSLQAGLNTVRNMLDHWEDVDEAEEEDDPDENNSASPKGSGITTLTQEERAQLEICFHSLDQGLLEGPSADPKWEIIRRYLMDEGWANAGCVLFSQYYDSAYWVAQQIKRTFPDHLVGLYVGGAKSGVVEAGSVLPKSRDEIKQLVQTGEIKLLVGTDAASEGLNLQRLGTLINIDLPWNPTRLEQRKGRIQRIGQVRSTVHVLNLRYAGSVEDKVHQALSQRLEEIMNLFGQIPDVLSEVWVEMALDERQKWESLLDSLPKQHPFDERYSRIQDRPGWDDCRLVLNKMEKLSVLRQGWKMPSPYN